MELELDSKQLIDSPFTTENAGLFVFDENQIQDFVRDLSFGQPTCYLVSGYRGVGKTSLIRKVEKEIATNNSDQKKQIETVFVYANFAGYESKTHIVRNLIRELFLRVDKTSAFSTLQKDKTNNFADKFRTLYQQTFKEVTQTTEHSSSTETEISTKFAVVDAFLVTLKQLAPLFGILIPILITLPTQLIRQIIVAGSIIWTIINVLDFQFSKIRKLRTSSNLYTRTLFDDEIAGTLLIDILKELNSRHFKIVFVFDELDKVSITQLDVLLNELKPYLVCGHADFIVVGGQNLYYKLYIDDMLDDSVLSSLFSRVYHVSLSSAAALKSLFYSKIVNQVALTALNEEERKSLDLNLDYIIFHSRLIPRRFMTRLRQNIIWRDKKVFVKFPEIPVNFLRCKDIIQAIETLDDDKIENENSKSIRDYILMTMYVNCYHLLNMKSSIPNKTILINGLSDESRSEK